MTPTVTVFVARGCGACDAYKAPFMAAAAPFRRRVRVLVVETTSAAGAKLAAIEGIRATPTTIVKTRRGTTLRRVGALDARGVHQLFVAAVG
jgi:hypothetical protein